MFLSIFYCIRYCKSQFTHKGDANKKLQMDCNVVSSDEATLYLLFVIHNPFS